jgi:hypothetical protein
MRPETTRIWSVPVLALLAFAAAYLIGHGVDRGGQALDAGQASTLPALPTPDTPIPGSLAAAPPMQAGEVVLARALVRSKAKSAPRTSPASVPAAVARTPVLVGATPALHTQAAAKGGPQSTTGSGSGGGSSSPRSAGKGEPGVSFDSSG